MDFQTERAIIFSAYTKIKYKSKSLDKKINYWNAKDLLEAKRLIRKSRLQVI